MQLLSKAISEILLGDTDITTVTGSGNIWHAKIPQRSTAGSDSPVSISIYFYVYSVTPNDTKTGRSDLDTVMVRVHVMGEDDSVLSNVARYTRFALDRVLPGVYAGIPIQGSRFLNAYYEPDGAYQLEKQEWILEFQFRVIDPEIRIPGGAMPSFPGFTGNYSTSEQVWPFSKHLNGETIYWMTWDLGVGIDDYVDLTGLLTATVEFITPTSVHLTKNTDDEWLSAGVELKISGTVYKVFTSSLTTENFVTLYYTKA